ncbi:hypothetical protein ARALYDRAFT_913813 [Arabidopsis lyrata subsp. lyrata]|uniref:RRM domain-containing protein n=1 Tax=Arabidopsis lyrata subsp. lyrata TaxID=81972 RepID=D7MEH1_ARALL|nr:hypothetical protein ARALYDRAFT_913813 [Arabidopsis lyrata subsp. lyrata]
MGKKELPGKKRKKSKSSTDFQELGVGDDDDMLALKKQKAKSQWQDIKKMTKSIKELSEAMKKLQEVLLTKVDLLEVSLKKEIAKNEKFLCCFDCEEAKGNNSKTIFVKGFNNAKPRDEIKHELRNFFRSCGGVERVFVPTECKTGVPLGSDK